MPQASKRKLTRSNSLPNLPCGIRSPGIERYFKTTKDAKDLSPKPYRSRRLTGSPSTRCSDLRKYLSQTSEKPAKRRIVSKRRVNLNEVFDSYIDERPTKMPIKEEPSVCYSKQPTGIVCSTISTEVSTTSYEFTADERPTIESVPLETEECCVSLVSYKTDPSSNPDHPPPPCIKRKWKRSLGFSQKGFKLFDKDSPRHLSRFRSISQKLMFPSPSPKKTHCFDTLEIRTES